MFPNILNLSQYRVLRVDETEHDYHIFTEIAAERIPCLNCRSSKIQRWGAREILFKDLPIHGKRVSLYVRARRLRCENCSRTFQERLPGLADRRFMTLRLLRWIGEQSLKRPFTAIAKEIDVDEGTIRNIFRDYVNELEAHPTATIGALTCALAGRRRERMI